MKATGIIRKVDDLGRIVLPAELRRLLDIHDHDPVEVYVDKDSIVLRKHQPACHFCDSDHSLRAFKGKIICTQCVGVLAGPAL